LKAIWVLENIREHRSFYTKFDLLMMFASVIQWRKHHPTHHCQLHADKLTQEVFTQLGVTRLWDSVKTVGKNRAIDKNVFWASSKLQALRTVEEPVVIMDNDFIVFQSFDKFLKNHVIVGHDEDGTEYYPKPLDPYIRKVKHIINRPQPLAVNCCFLYLPDSNFTQYYAKTSLELMQEFTKLKAPSSKYLIYAEQLLLKHLLTLHNVQYKPLLDTVYDSEKNEFTRKTKGLIKLEKYRKYFRHYWMDKPKIIKNSHGFVYDDEIKQLENVVKNHILVDWSIIC
jgi:hypothetical protein